MSGLAGSKTRVRRVPGGRVTRRRCEDCDAVTEWEESDVLDRVELLGVSLLDMTSRRFVCRQCGQDLHPDDVVAPAPRRAAAPPEPPAPRSPRDVAWISPHRAGPYHPEIDEEIARIRRRLTER